MFKNWSAVFSERNMRIYFAGQFISLIGTWMEATAILWQVSRLAPHGSVAIYVGCTAALQSMPSMLFGPFGGAIVDRYGLRSMYVNSQAAAMLVAAFLATTSFLGLTSLTMLLVCSALLGTIRIIDQPSQNGIISILVTPQNLRSATGLSTAIIASSMTVGGAIAGLVIAHYGTSWAYLLNALSFIGTIIALLLVVPVTKHLTPPHNAFRMTIEGSKHIFKRPSLSIPLCIAGLNILLGSSYQRVLVVIAQQLFNKDARTFGYLLAASGIGAACGGALAGTFDSGKSIYSITRVSLVVTGCMLWLFSGTHSLHLAYVELVIIGTMLTTAHPAIRAELQKTCGQAMLGRVMGWGATLNFGALSIGSLLAGFTIQHYGARFDLRANAILAIIAGLCVPLLERFTLRDVTLVQNATS